MKDVPKLKRTNLQFDCIPTVLTVKHHVFQRGLRVPAVHCGETRKQGLTTELADVGASQSMAELDARLFPTCIDLPDVFVAGADHDDHVAGLHDDLPELQRIPVVRAVHEGCPTCRRRFLRGPPTEFLFAILRNRVVGGPHEDREGIEALGFPGITPSLAFMGHRVERFVRRALGKFLGLGAPFHEVFENKNIQASLNVGSLLIVRHVPRG